MFVTLLSHDQLLGCWDTWILFRQKAVWLSSRSTLSSEQGTALDNGNYKLTARCKDGLCHFFVIPLSFLLMVCVGHRSSDFEGIADAFEAATAVLQGQQL